MREITEAIGVNPYYQDDAVVIYHADCRDILPQLPDKSIDLLYSNPPFGITDAEWDKPLNWNELWPYIWRFMKQYSAVVLHSSMPFTFDLVASCREYFRYNYVWIKNNKTNFFLADKQPLRGHEDICVFYQQQPTYNPQMFGDAFHKMRLVKHGGMEKYWGKAKYIGKWGIETDEGGHYGRYPSTVLIFPVTKASPYKSKPSTRVPSFIDFFILTYSNEEEIILDITCNEGATLQRCRLLNRKCIGIEIEEKYCEIAAKRLSQSVMRLEI